MVSLLAALALQASGRPTWAVTEFHDLKVAGSSYGRVAADEFAADLARDGQYEVVSKETVDRSIESLGLASPLVGLVDLSRVGQELQANAIVQGEVVDYRLDRGGPARAAIRVVAYDVISGLPIGGAVTVGEADVRSGETKVGTLQQAIGRAAYEAVATMRGQWLSTATVLNTTTRTAMIDRGSRSGFKTGETVIVTRDNFQIGTARVGAVELNRAEIVYGRLTMGIAPGDRVRAVFKPPALPSAGESLLDRPLPRGLR